MRAALLVVLCACSSAFVPPRAEARAAVLSIAYAVKAADEMCAFQARTKNDADLAQGCADDYAAARLGLLAAEKGLDDDELAKVGCDGALAVERLRAMMLKLGSPKVPGIDDALVMANRLQQLAPCAR